MSDPFYPTLVVQLSEEDGGGFAAFAPDLYGCMGDGETPEAALADLQNAIVEWCDEMVRLGRAIPAPGSCVESEKADRAGLIELIQEQADLLEEQDATVAELQDQVHALSQRVADVLASQESRERGSFANWHALVKTGVLASHKSAH